jgi:tetratricopeptide (TPR) repeat protein
MKRWPLLLLSLALAAVPVRAQTIVLKDGRVIVGKALRRQGESILATVDIPAATAGQPAQTGELGYTLAQIARLEFPEPGQLRSAPDLILQGKAEDALAQLEPVLKYYEPFRDALGSWWGQAALLESEALLELKRDADAATLIDQIIRVSADPEAVRTARVLHAAALVRQGSGSEAAEICQAALKESKDPRTLAAAAVVKGQSLLLDKQWEDAVLAFLQVPVFYPGEKLWLPQSLLGVGRAHFGMDNFTAARAALDELLQTYAATREAAEAKVELENIARREKALAGPQ